MKERPIIMTAESVRAILDGRKTQTRRVIKPTQKTAWLMDGGWTDDYIKLPGNFLAEDCRYGVPGDQLWVRELIRKYAYSENIDTCFYDADLTGVEYKLGCPSGWCGHALWQWSKLNTLAHSPRWASRITLEITGVRVERLTDISEEDVEAEGLALQTWSGHYDWPRTAGFAELWDSINADRGYPWDSNPWVWVIEFERVDK